MDTNLKVLTDWLGGYTLETLVVYVDKHDGMLYLQAKDGPDLVRYKLEDLKEKEYV